MKIIENPQLATERKLPWLIDIPIYPASVSGIIHLAIFILAPLLLWKLVLPYLDVFHGVLTLILYILVIGYFLYYFGHCVFDSSRGGCRAPDIAVYNTPGKSELLSQFFLTFGATAAQFCWAGVYYVFTKRTDSIFWALTAGGIFFLPMALLRVTLFDSVDALNPLVIIRSISKTFFPYCGLVLIFCALGGLLAPLITNLPIPVNLRSALNYIPIVLNYLLGTTLIYHKIAFIYLAFVAAHLLGRFYWWHKDKLDWGL